MSNNMKTSFDGLINFLENYKTSEILTEPKLIEGLKNLHKQLYALLCWKTEFYRQGKFSELQKWFDESISDLIQIIPLLVQGFYKVCNTAHRSALENLIRCVVVSGGHNPSEITTVYQLFEKAREIAIERENIQLKTRIDIIYQIYSELCNYVHTSGDDYSTFAQALNEYPNFVEEKFTSTLKEIIKSLKLINVIIFMIERETFNSMYHINKEAILDNMTADEKRILH